MSLSPEHENEPRSPRRASRRRLQFGLRTLLAFTALAAGGAMGWRGCLEPYRRQLETAKLIQKLGGTYQAVEAPRWVCRLGGEDYQVITLVNLADSVAPDNYIEAIAALPALETLVVGGPAFTDDHLRRLQGLPSLRALVLDSTSASDEFLARWQREAPQVQIVQSQRTAIRLARQRVRIDTLDDEAHRPLAEEVGWEFFQVPTSALMIEYWLEDRAFDNLKKLKGLSKIDLQHTEARDDRLRHLADMVDLEELNLFGTQVTDAGLVHLRGLTNLKSLDLRLKAVGDDGLAHLRGLRRLRRLDLWWSSVTDEGLAHLKDMTEMRWLRLRETRITDAGLVHLAAMSRLEYLDLGDTQVTRAGLIHLQGLTRLRSVYLGSFQW